MKENNCEYFPCHKKMEDCTFCYCPIYPCDNFNLGSFTKDGIWDCSKCNIFHKKKNINLIKTFMRGIMEQYR
jgi:Zn-finger protein